MKKLQIQFILFFFVVGFSASAQNQNKLFADFGNGSYTTYKSEISYDYNNVKHIKFDKVSKPWPVTVSLASTKDFDGNTQVESVTVARQGVIKEKFIADIPENPVYFAYKDFRISLIDDKIYYYEWNNDNATIIYLLTKSSVSSYENEVEKINNHVRNSFKNQQGAKGKIAQVKDANAKKEAAENSIKGKTIKSLEIVLVDVPTELGCRSLVRFGVKATSTDGRIYSTANIGGKTLMDDFTVTTNDGLYIDDAIEIHQDASKITNDELKFIVASKYMPSVKAQKSIPLNYAFTTFDVKQNGATSDEIMALSAFKDGKIGAPGKNIEVKIQKAITKSGNFPIYKVEVKELLTGKIVNRVKIGQHTILNIYAVGGYGGDGFDSKKPFGGTYRKADDGKNGGDGGNVIVSKSADATAVQLNVINKGGAGGKGGVGAGVGLNGVAGKNGNDGRVTTKLLTENLAW